MFDAHGGEGRPALPLPVRKAADWLLVLTVVSVPLSTTGMEAGVIGLGVLSAVAAVRGWGVVRRTPLDAVLGIFYGTLALSTLASLRPLEAVGWSRLWVVLAYFTVFWWLRDRAHAVGLARLLVVAGAVAGAYGVLQHFTGVDWYRDLLGRQRYVRPREAGGARFAAVGFFRNYLTFAHTMLFPLGWAAAFAARGSTVAAAAAVLVVLAIVFSTARGAWVAVLVIALALGAMARGRRTLALGAAIGAAAALAFAVTPELRAQAAHMFSPGGANAARLAIYRANLDVIHDHPVLGLGFGRYQRAAGPYYDAHPDADRRSHAHNNYLQIAAEAGLVGLAAWGLVYAHALRLGWGALAAAPDGATWAAAAGAWAAIIGFLVGGATQYNFGDAEVAIAMWVALAVLMRCREP